ncbi:M56 family metallopeptidase [Hymenobacter psoromatis]|uniref:M56 family metallopeptidase n=1 Tax=Hymenobacter psoromatis TaxID=1484116 RepID=UPI001CBAA806|nr:M56 family metallopeptidase [Hymenobacter psoromatis]
MTTLPWLNEVLSPALVRGVGYALLHSLWQGGVLALLLAGALPLLRRHRAEVRYALAAGALGTLLLAAGGTFGYYYDRAVPLAEAAPVILAGGPGPLASATLRGVGTPTHLASAAPAAPLSWPAATRQQLEPYLPLVVLAWLLGLVVLSGRLAGGLLYADRLRRTGTRALGREWQQRLAALAARAGLRHPVALLESARVAGPLVLGHLRPAILLPLGAVAGLSPSLLEALLAHELAHVVRRDYLLNLGLAVVEVLFFYHPAVWFMAGRLRAERENCCDDQAAALCGGDRLRVARALAALAELTTADPATPPRLALAATGGGRGQLLARVRRLVLSRPPAPTLRERLLAGALTLLGLLGLSTGVGLAARPALAAPVQTVPAPGDTARRGATVPMPIMPNSPREIAETEQNEMPAREPRPHRGRASTVVMEKDKKGRVVSLTVDGQPVETASAGKKHKPGKVASTEIVQVPGPAAGPERLSLSFDFSTDELTSRAQRELAKAQRNPSLNEEQRQQMQREMAKLQQRMQTFQAEMGQQFQHFQFDFDRDTIRRSLRNRLRFDINSQTVDDNAADQTEANIRHAEANIRRAEADSRLADDQAEANIRRAEANGRLAETNTRRAELRARLAADAAELRALERGDGQTPPMPVPPRAPMAQTGPPLPQTPPPPAPAPKTEELRAALRQDGLIGKNDRSFSFSLNDKGGRVNGRALTPTQVARYRQLLGQPVSGQGKSSTFNIHVDEN